MGGCGDPSYVDITGSWAPATWGAAQERLIVVADDSRVTSDFDVLMTLSVDKPARAYEDPPTSGWICLRDAVFGFDGIYAIDPSVSVYEARAQGLTVLRMSARATDGRTLEVEHGRAPEGGPHDLSEVMIALSAAGASAPTVRMEYLVLLARPDLVCPPK